MSHIRVCGAAGPPLRGRATIPGDKSISHRAILLNMLAGGTARVTNFLPAGDCRASLRVAGALGAEVEVLSPTELRVHGRGMALLEPDDVLDCGRSGTTMRLLAGILAGQPFAAVLSGDAQLRRRPMARVAGPLRLMGATVLGRDGGRLPPLVVQGGTLRGIEYSLPVASAQGQSALLRAGLGGRGATTLHGPAGARDDQEQMLRAMGAEVTTRAGNGGHTLRVGPTPALAPLDLAVPGDFSSAAFILVAATLVPGSEVVLEGVGINPTRTGLLDLLRSMGAEIEVRDEGSAGGEPVADLAVRGAGLAGVEVGGDLVVRAIDELPILAVAATQARGETLVRDAAELRVKETDRVATTVAELRRLGADIEARPDGFLVRGPTRLRGAAVHSHGDHRLAMALVVAGLVAEGETVVHDCDCIPDSFPGFEALLAGLGGRIAP